MFWTLTKILLFVVVVIALAFGLGQLMDSAETVEIRAFDMEFVLSPLMALGALAVFVALIWVAFKLVALGFAVLRFMNGDETAIRRFFVRNREKRGLDALLVSMVAQAEGDGKTAIAKAEKAHKLLNKPAMTNLLVAQAAEMKGNPALAIERYKALLDDNRTRFVAVQGLIRAKLETGEKDKASALAVKALEMQPTHEATQNTLLQLQTEAEDWSGARKTLMLKKNAGALPRDIWRRRDAILALQDSDAMAARGDLMRSREAAIEANRLSPDLIPAAVAAAHALIAQGNGTHAAKVLKRAWKAQPHPELAAAFAAIEPDETPQQRASRFEGLLRKSPDAAETRMLRAEMQLAAENFPEARRALGDLHEKDPTARVLTIMAAIERGEGADDFVVRGWLTRALTAKRGPQWVCSKCQHVHASWQAVCDGCGAFDTLEWRDAPEASGPSATQTELLPLIVGGAPKSVELDPGIVEAEANDTATGSDAPKPA